MNYNALAITMIKLLITTPTLSKLLVPGRGIGERGRGGDACSKNPLFFISADAGVRKFLIG